MESSKILKWKVKEEIGFLTISNPPQNYLTDPEIVDLDILKGWIENDNIKGVIISGEGRHFSGGAKRENIKRRTEHPSLMEKELNNGKDILNYIEDLLVPTIAAINGACLGGGLEIALSCHIRVCSEDAILGFPEVNIGLIPGLGGTFKLPTLIGLEEAIQLIMTGEIINAEEAKRIGLVNYVVSKKENLTFSVNLMKRMVSNKGIDTIHSVMQAIKNYRKMDCEDALLEETKMFCKLALNLKRKDDM